MSRLFMRGIESWAFCCSVGDGSLLNPSWACGVDFA